MIIKQKNAGTYIDYALDGAALSFGGGALTVKLTEHQRDWSVQLDISADSSGVLVLGPARQYVAQLTIPARSYDISKGKADDFGFPQLFKTAAPLDTDHVVLTLWALEV